MTYDKNADSAYIYFNGYPADIVDKTYPCDSEAIEGMINLDFTKGKLVGIEVMAASKKLSEELLSQAEMIGWSR